MTAEAIHQFENIMTKEEIKEYKKQYYKDNMDKRKIYNIKNADKLKQWYIDNAEKIKEYRKQYGKQWRIDNKEYGKQWSIDNKEYRKQYQNNKKKIDIQYKIKCNLRSRIYKVIKNQQKTGSAVKDLGCTIITFKKYIEAKFKDGMTWDNYGEWHLDHILPLSCFNLEDRKQFLIACNYTNYQPLWAKDNLIKSDKSFFTYKLKT